MLHDLTSDLRSAGRMLVRNPGTSSVIVATLALAIGAATIGFAFADLVLLRGLPIDDKSKVVSVSVDDRRGSMGGAHRVSAADFLDYKARTRTLNTLSAFKYGRAALIRDGQSQTVSVVYATADVFASMGQRPFAGRLFLLDEDRPGASKVAVLAYRYWKNEMQGRADAVGRTLQIGRDHYTVVGIASPQMEVGNLGDVEMWLPITLDASTAPRDARNLRFLARLNDDATFEQARVEMAAIGSALSAEFPTTNAGWNVTLVPVNALIGGDSFWVVIALFLLSIGLLIAIATANVSNLVMVRAMARQRELAVRAALGARRGRLIRQLLVEGTLLSIVAGVLAVGFAYGGMQVLAGLSPEPVFRQLSIDSHEFLFVASLALLCPALFSLAPARTLARTDTRQVLAAGGSRGATASTRGRSTLVVAQVALAVVLLMASTLAVRSINKVYSAPTGLDSSRSLVLTLDFNDAQYAEAADAASAARATDDALSHMSGVERVATVSALPILGAEAIAAVEVDGEARPAGESSPSAIVTRTDAEGGAALGLRMLAGCWWDRQATGAAVVSRETATRYLGGLDAAIGRHLSYQGLAGRITVRVVGVSNDVVRPDFAATPPARLWVSMDVMPRRLTYVVQARSDASQLISGTRTAVAQIAPSIPIEDMETFDQGLKRAQSSDYIIVGMLAGFAGLALLLASAGLFGVVSFSAAQRTAEFGTRMALGASAWDVVRLVSVQSLKLFIIGLAIGLAGGAAVGRSMGSVLNGLSPFDPVTVTGITALLAAVTMVATAIPAFCAARINPVIALRAE